MALAILHRDPGTVAADANLPVWRTCLREIVFLNECDIPEQQRRGERYLSDSDAYHLLLEILCGLRSPMIGETQVLGQFKAFLGSLSKDHAPITKLGQRLLGDAKDVRTKHLQGLGSRSYGSAVRRDLADCTQAVVIGTGKLADEVLPFLGDNGRFVDQWGRADAAAVKPSDRVCYRPLSTYESVPVSDLPTALVVAAPVATECVEGVAAKYSNLVRIIDLRADVGGRAPSLPGVEVVSLQELFARMDADQNAAVPRIEAARREIAWRTRQYELRDELRPFGWDDLCA